MDRMPSTDDIQVLPSIRRVRRDHRGVASLDAGKLQADSADSNAAAYLRQVRRLRQQYANDPGRLQHYLGELSRVRDKASPRITLRTVVRSQSSFSVGARLSPAATTARAGEDARAPSGSPHSRFSRAVVDWFADHVAAQLDDKLLHYSNRQALLKTAERLGIGRFHANLIIAVEQHQAGEAKIPDVKLYPVRGRSTLITVAIVLAVQALIVAAGWFMLHS